MDRTLVLRVVVVNEKMVPACMLRIAMVQLVSPLVLVMKVLVSVSPRWNMSSTLLLCLSNFGAWVATKLVLVIEVLQMSVAGLVPLVQGQQVQRLTIRFRLTQQDPEFLLCYELLVRWMNPVPRTQPFEVVGQVRALVLAWTMVKRLTVLFLMKWEVQVMLALSPAWMSLVGLVARWTVVYEGVVLVALLPR